MMPRTIARLLLALLMTAHVVVASAQTRAWLDRDRIALGETTTLNIETDQLLDAAPDYSALMNDFQISNNVSSRQFEVVNGVSHSRVLFAIALQPRREGVITLPRLLVGNVRVQPPSLTVTASTATPAHAGDPVFVETEADAQEPYVQQAVGLTVRLYYSGPISGQLDQPDPDGATMQRVGEDTQYARQIGARAYSVLERHFLLIPERSGTLTIPGAHFKGTGTPGFFDDLLGNGGRPLQANSAPRFLHVLEAPADAPQPWLPLRALTLRYLETPQRGRAGESITVTVEATADGATAAQMPPLQLVAGGGAQVFAEPAQSDESFADGRPKVRTVRRFSIVPAQAGTLRITGPSQAWWDVRARLRRTASLPDLNVPVRVGANGTGAPAPPGIGPGEASGADAGLRVPGVQGTVQPWALAAVVFAAAWLVTLMWALRRRQEPTASAVREASTVPAHASARVSLREFKRALDHEDLGRVADVLCALRVPPALNLDGVSAALEDADQVAAVEALQRARWGDGDGVRARTLLREAFRRGPSWKRTARVPVESPLPPLYPRD